ncbi:NAD-dependent epimerase/dehydratase family protein [Pseudonocardia sp. RS010]|uniref:NAD-dependent epimerase/dehydratase family protein n=1 Tax=Pseudonocardia sp. RS010 TaxID=3385979 RepID=UPI0039A08C6C
MRAVVTGGAGFIGSHLVDALLGRGATVLVVDDLSRGSLANLRSALAKGARLVEADIRDGPTLRTAMTEFRPDVVCHLAAQIDVRKSMAEPALDAAINVVGSVNVLAAAHEAGARRVVNTSTGGAIYGETSVVPTPEAAPAAPLSPYGLSKRTVETYAEWFRSARGLDVVTLRYGNVYGPRQDPRGDAGVIAIFCEAALAGQRPTIFGDGTQTRDYVFVGDIVAANLAAVDAADLPHPVYNVGTGTEVDLLTLVEQVRTAAGLDVLAPDFRPARPGEVLRSCLDVTRAREELGFSARTSLVEGLRATLAWIRELPQT